MGPYRTCASVAPPAPQLQMRGVVGTTPLFPLCVTVYPAGSCATITQEVARGVYLSLQALPQGGYELKRVRFAKQVRSGGSL